MHHILKRATNNVVIGFSGIVSIFVTFNLCIVPSVNDDINQPYFPPYIIVSGCKFAPASIYAILFTDTDEYEE